MKPPRSLSRFFEDTELQEGSEVVLCETTSHHIHTVLRMEEGDELVLFNGRGGEYSGALVKSHKKHSEVSLSGFTPDNRTPDIHIHLGQVMGKGDKMEWIIQKAVEMGIREITPLTSLHSDYKLKAERQEKKFRQWQQIAISACEQSGINILPKIHPVQAFSEWAGSAEGDQKWLLHPASNSQQHCISGNPQIVLAVGPEGGFAREELETALSQGFTQVELGQRILRTETAAIAASAYIYGLSGRYS